MYKLLNFEWVYTPETIITPRDNNGICSNCNKFGEVCRVTKLIDSPTERYGYTSKPTIQLCDDCLHTIGV